MLRSTLKRGMSWLTGCVRGRPRDFLLKRMPKNAVCAEIGVYKGDFSARILQATQPRRLHLIDPWKYETESTYHGSHYGGQESDGQAKMDAIHGAVVDRFGGELAAGTVQIHRDASAAASLEFEAEYFDWIYVDGNHLYEFVKQDLGSFYPKVKPGGFITGDDYTVRGWWDSGVQRAVDEFAEATPCERVLFQETQFILRKQS